MANLRDIRRRIGSVRSTQKITRAMKMVAAAKLRRAQDALVAARPYADKLGGLVDNVARRAQDSSHPLLRQTAGGKVVVVVCTSDRGLCGSFNASILNRFRDAQRQDFEGRDIEVIAVGRKGAELLRRRGVEPCAIHTGLNDRDKLAVSQALLKGVIAEFTAGNAGAVYILYNEFRSALVQTARLERLLPLEQAKETGEIVSDYLYEPSVDAVLEKLLIHKLEIQVRRILLEAEASEHGARMTSMESATKNAGDMIERLTLQYNRVRQDAITTEMIEIISGAEAL